MRRLIRLSVFLGLSLLIHAGMSRLLDDQALIHNPLRSVRVSLIALQGAENPESVLEQEPAAEPLQETETIPDDSPGPDLQASPAEDASRRAEEEPSGPKPVVRPIAVRSDLEADLYREKVIDIIRRNLRYPAGARRRGLEGTVDIRLSISGSGTAGEVLIEKTSGSDILDRASVRAVEACVFPAPPHGTATLRIPITFRLVERP